MSKPYYGAWDGFDRDELIDELIDEIKMLQAEIKRLHDSIARMRGGRGPDDPANCPGGHKAACCGYHSLCAENLSKTGDLPADWTPHPDS